MNETVHEDREEAIRQALENSDPGDTITICRGEGCPDDEICPMCARVTVVHGMTVEDVIKMARPNRA